MGQSDVLEWLEKCRYSGDHTYRSYTMIHRGMLRDGKSFNYTSVWWSIVCLHDQGRLDAVPLGSVLSRRWVFRAKVRLHSTCMQRVYNTSQESVKKSLRRKQEEVFHG